MRRAITIAALATAHVTASGCWGSISYSGGDATDDPDTGVDGIEDWAGDTVPDGDFDAVLPDSPEDVVPDSPADTLTDLPADVPPPDLPADPPVDVPPEPPVDLPVDPPADFVPGDGSVGEACAAIGDCALVPSDTAFCMTDMWGFISFPGGYCTGFCGSDAECGPGGGCDVGQCFLRCTSDAECRAAEGYTCHAIPFIGPDTYCLPG